MTRTEVMIMTNKDEQGAPTALVPAEIHDIAQAIADGRVKNAKMEWTNGSISFVADSADGTARFVLEKQEFGGVVSEAKTNIPKPSDKEQRLQRVKVLKEQGKTQVEIAKFTMTSQRTVSNDIKELKSSGLLK